MKVLVTGGTGFVGKAVCARLVQQGDTPLVLDRHQCAGPRTDYETLLGDVRDDAAVEAAVRMVEGVIHCAALLGTQETVAVPAPAAETNILGSLHVWDAVRRFQVPAVYITVGNHWMLNPYSITKTTAEKFAWMYNREHGTRIAVVRALNAYGPGQKLGPVRKILPTFITQALQGKPIEIYGDGRQIMDMIHVRDVADVLVRALKAPAEHYTSGVAYEAGTGRPTNVNHIAKAVWCETHHGAVTYDVQYLPMRPGEPPRSVVLGDPKTLKPLYGADERFAPIRLETGVAETVEYYRQQRAGRG